MWSEYSRAMLAEAVREELGEWLGLGATLEQVQEELLRLVPELSEDDRAALWLYAWSYCHARTGSVERNLWIGAGG